jgi:hypothetical protein
VTDIPHEIDLTAKPKWSHEVYGGPGIDMGKVREDAHRLQRGDSYKGPESTLVHFHRYEEPCEGRDHTKYEIDER